MLAVLIVDAADAAAGEDEYAGMEEVDVEESNEDATADMQEK